MGLSQTTYLGRRSKFYSVYMSFAKKIQRLLVELFFLLINSVNMVGLKKTHSD